VRSAWSSASIASRSPATGEYYVYQFTGDPQRTRNTARRTHDWVSEVQERGAGEIVLNCMSSDGMRAGYDIAQLASVRRIFKVPLVASGGAGRPEHFAEAFNEAHVDGALAASVFHTGALQIPELKHFLRTQGIEVRQ
jgi:imidazole glycerol-phosphate synthase subunit HisF